MTGMVQGVYYGVFPGDKLGDDGVPSTVWVVSRPHNWRPKSTVERLLELDMRTGASERLSRLAPAFVPQIRTDLSQLLYLGGRTVRQSLVRLAEFPLAGRPSLMPCS